jgi:hypothetical protein
MKIPGFKYEFNGDWLVNAAERASDQTHIKPTSNPHETHMKPTQAVGFICVCPVSNLQEKRV